MSASAAERPRARILLVEDDVRLGAQVQATLEREGYAVRWLRHGAEAAAVDPERLQLVVLDLGLPGVDGLTVLQELRKRSDVPILLLTARSAPEDRVRGLEAGADDYLAKPFWPGELLARVRARLRRPALAREAGLRLGPLSIDTLGQRLELDGREVEVTAAEMAILVALARRPGAAVTRRVLAAHALDPDAQSDRHLDAHVSRLRQKLGGHAHLVETVRGIGYRLRAEGSETER